MSDYWTIWAETALDEAGLDATPEQISEIVKSVQFAHDDYGAQHGHREADLGLKRMDREEARERMFVFIEEQMRALDCGPNFFDRLNTIQKEALARLMCVRKEFARKPWRN